MMRNQIFGWALSGLVVGERLTGKPSRTPSLFELGIGVISPPANALNEPGGSSFANVPDRLKLYPALTNQIVLEFFLQLNNTAND